MLPGAMSAARATGIPVVLVMHTLYGYWDAQWSPRTPMGLWLRLTGALPTARSRRPDAAIVTTMPELDPLPEHTRIPRSLLIQTGPALRSPPTDPAADDGPIVISLSTISYPGQLELLQRLIDVTAELPVRALVTTGPSLDPAALRAPSNVSVQRFVDHDEVMPTARLVVGHGGHGTTMRALSHGVPVLVVPMSSLADHHLVGAAVTDVGAGATVSKRASPAELRAAITGALDDATIRAGARRIANQLAERDGVTSGADAIEQVVAR
jgi:UDP:flavonoid glycosyltransferase YjiC (YdhE family)